MDIMMAEYKVSCFQTTEQDPNSLGARKISLRVDI